MRHIATKAELVVAAGRGSISYPEVYQRPKIFGRSFFGYGFGHQRGPKAEALATFGHGFGFGLNNTFGRPLMVLLGIITMDVALLQNIAISAHVLLS